MGYDNLLSKAGDFGPYQKLLSGIFVFYTTLSKSPEFSSCKVDGVLCP